MQSPPCEKTARNRAEEAHIHVPGGLFYHSMFFRPLMHQAEKVLFEGMPIIPVYFYNQVHLEKENVKGIIRHPVGYIELKWAEKT